MSLALIEALKVLSSGQDLAVDETEAAVHVLLSGEASEAASAAFLTALRVKGETEGELAGTVRAVRSRMEVIGLDLPAFGVLDTCGTGGDGANTVNVSSATAVVVAACGIRVAKHGNRSASGNSGSSEVFAELGIAIEAPLSVVSRCLAEAGITFLFAPRFHPGLKHLATIRGQLPFRTVFNLVGPLVNPARPDFQLVGVAGERQGELVAGALKKLGTRRAAVVTGADGLDEVTLSGSTRVLLVEGGQVHRLTWTPLDFGLGWVELSDLRVSGPSESAARISHTFAGEPGPVRDVIVANSAAALWVAGEPDLKKGVERAIEAIESGAASRVLKHWREVSHQTA